MPMSTRAGDVVTEVVSIGRSPGFSGESPIIE
jgi:hypothetical protein